MTHHSIEPLEARIAPAALSIGSASAPEEQANGGSQTLSFTVSLDVAATTPVTVNYATADGTAAAGSDYSARSGALSFAVGETEKTVTISVLPDSVFEADETFFVNLSNARGASIAAGQGTGTIQDNDAAPEVRIAAPGALLEGDSGTTTAGFTVSLSAAAGVPITVNAATMNGTATAGEDYVAFDRTITFPAGTLTMALPVTVNGDTADEPDEMFSVVLSNPSAGKVSATAGSATATIRNDDLQVTIGDVSIPEGNSQTKELVFPITLSAVSNHDVSVDFTTVAGTAAAGSDYVTKSGTATIAAGQVTGEIRVTINGDTLVEPDETFTVVLSNPVNATLSNTSGTGTIASDDIGLSIGNASAVESAGSIVFPVTLVNGTPGQAVTVNFTTMDGTAVTTGTVAAGTLDYTPAPANSSIVLTPDAEGNATGSITVILQNDAVTEGTAGETFRVQISSPDIVTITSATGTGTILDDESVLLSIEDVTIVEQDTGSQNAVFSLSLNRPATAAVTVNYATAPGTAVSAGPNADFVAQSGTVTIPAGQQFATIVVTVNGDSIREAAEQFTVNLTGATNAGLAKATGTGTIVDNDDAQPLPVVTIAGASVTEGNGGTAEPAQLTFVVTLSQRNEREAVTVSYSTVDGTAAGSDFTGVTNGTVTFEPGQTTANITIDVTGDTLGEATEMFQVQLANPMNATLSATSAATGTIIDDDIAATIADATFSEGDTGETEQTMTVTLSSAPAAGSTVTVNFTVGGGTATNGTDYRLTDPAMTSLVFAEGETSKTIRFTVLGDELDEEDETFNVTLTSVTGGVLGTESVGMATITDDDAAPTVSIAGATRIEGNAGAADLGFAVTLSAASAKTVTASAGTLMGTATENVDFTQIAGQTITFAPGETVKTFNVPILGDTADELDETFTVQLSDAINATIAEGTATGTITDDDVSVVSIADARVAEGAAGQTAQLVFTVSVPDPAPADITVSYATSDGTATAGSDYTAAGGMVTIPAGQTSATVSIAVTGDDVFEPDETLTVTLSAPSGDAVLGRAAATGTIQTDEVTYKLTPVTPSAPEEDAATGLAGQVVFKVVREGNLTLPGAVTFATADNGSAVAGADYVAQTGTLNFAAGETEKNITVSFIADNARETTETFLVQLTGSTNGVLVNAANEVQQSLSATASILDNDLAPAISIGDAAVTEGSAGAATDLIFTVTLSAANETGNVTVNFATVDGSAISTATAAMTQDFIAQSGTLTFMPGETSKTIVVKVNPDLINEQATETLSVMLSGAGGATILNGTGTGTITDDDAVSISITGLTAGGLSVQEGSAANLPVTLSRVSEQTLVVNLDTVALTATRGTDFNRTDAFGSTLTFAPGQTTKLVTFSLTADSIDEENETFRVDLSGATNGATIATPSATVTILDSDPTPSITVNSVSVGEGDAGLTPLTFTVTLTGASDRPVTVNYATADGTARSTAPLQDYQPVSGTLTFAPGETTKTVVVNVIGDTVAEPDETFFLNLSGAQNGTLTAGTGTGTILNDGDTIRALTIKDARVVEGGIGAAPQAVFTVSLSSPATTPVTFTAATRDGTAVAGSDFTGVNRTVTIAAGQSSATVSVTISGDSEFEATESFFVDIVNPSEGVTVLDGEGRGTIYNDDILRVSNKVVKYIDEDGDLATVRITRGVLTFGIQGAVLQFSNPNAIGGRTLQLIDFTGAPSVFNHTDVFVTAAPQPGFRASGGESDGLVNVGFIRAGVLDVDLLQLFNNSDLGIVKIEGDLGKIIAGDQIATDRAIRFLSVVSHGALRDSSVFVENDNNSLALGGITAIKAKGDFLGNLQVVGGFRGDVDSLRIDGALRGDERARSGEISVTGTLARAKIGAIVGGAGASSGRLFATFLADSTVETDGTIGQVRVLGDIVGGSGAASGAILSPSIGKVVVGGDVTGGAGQSSAHIEGAGRLNRVIIKGDLAGGGGLDSGEVLSSAAIKEVKVRGSVLGGAGASSGAILAQLGIGSVKVTGDIEGGAGGQSGSVRTGLGIGRLQIGKSGVEDSGDLAGGAGANSGQVRTGKSVGVGILFGGIAGGTGSASGGLNLGGSISFLRVDGDIAGGMLSGNAADSGFVVAKRIDAMKIGGDVVAGTGAGSGSIRASGNIGSLDVAGDVLGSAGGRVLISAGGTTGVANNQTIEFLKVGGNIAFADILGGYSPQISAANRLGVPENPDARIGKVKILGTTEATNIVAGVIAGADGRFGTADDAIISGNGIENATGIRAKIGKVVFKGAIAGTADIYGVVAEIVAAAKVNGTNVTTRPTVDLGAAGSNFKLLEIFPGA